MPARPEPYDRPASGEDPGRLLDRYDGLLLDLDGVIYLGDRPVPGAVEAMAAVRESGQTVRFLTNNASRTPAQVAERLQELGVAAAVEEVVTSAVCAAQALAGRLPTGAPVLAVGGDGLSQALEDAGLQPVDTAADLPVAVLQGWAPSVGWRQLAEAAVAIRAGAHWMATNLDLTIPSERGRLPGNGSLVGAVRAAVGIDPETVGKPEPAMYVAAAAGMHRPLAVGDRLDTDIAGACRAGFDSLLVMSGVSTAADLLAAPEGFRPTYLGPDLAAVLTAVPVPTSDSDGWRCRDAWVGREQGGFGVTGAKGPDGLDRLRAAAAAAAASGIDGNDLSDLDL